MKIGIICFEVFDQLQSEHIIGLVGFEAKIMPKNEKITEENIQNQYESEHHFFCSANRLLSGESKALNQRPL